MSWISIQQQNDHAARTMRRVEQRQQDELTQTMVEAIHLRRRVVNQEQALNKEKDLTKQQAQKIEDLEREQQALRQESERLRHEREELEKSVHRGRMYLRNLVMKDRAIAETVTFLKQHPALESSVGDIVEEVLKQKRTRVEEDPAIIKEADFLAYHGVPMPGQ